MRMGTRGEVLGKARAVYLDLFGNGTSIVVRRRYFRYLSQKTWSVMFLELNGAELEAGEYTEQPPLLASQVGGQNVVAIEAFGRERPSKWLGAPGA
jgi:hypothetical protein